MSGKYVLVFHKGPTTNSVCAYSDENGRTLLDWPIEPRVGEILSMIPSNYFVDRQKWAKITNKSGDWLFHSPWKIIRVSHNFSENDGQYKRTYLSLLPCNILNGDIVDLTD